MHYKAKAINNISCFLLSCILVVEVDANFSKFYCNMRALFGWWLNVPALPPVHTV